jgi:hypothetical protein
MLRKKREDKTKMNEELTKQIQSNLDKKFTLMETEKVGDAINVTRARSQITRENQESRQKNST